MSRDFVIVHVSHRARQVIEVRDLSNAVVKTIKAPVPTNEIFYGGTASLILSSTTTVVLYDIQQQKTLAELNSPPVKYAVWSADGSMVALMSKHSMFCFCPSVFAYLLCSESYHNRQQELLPAQSYTRDHPHQVGSLGRCRGVHLLDAQPRQILSRAGVSLPTHALWT